MASICLDINVLSKPPLKLVRAWMSNDIPLFYADVIPYPYTTNGAGLANLMPGHHQTRFLM